MDRTFALPLPRTLSRPRWLALPRRPLLTLAIVLLALPVLAGGWLLLRDSRLVAVEHVRVLGAQGPEAHAIEAALEEAGLRMSTLHVNAAALQAAVAPLRVVRAVRVSTAFPHTLRVRVIEQPPVAALVVGGLRTAVAADGAVLGSALLSSSLPVVPGATGDPLGTGHVRSAAALAALTVLGAAPPTLAGWVARVYEGREGLTVAMRNGLQIYFGDASRPHAKWLSAARVLADASSAGAWYVDVRLPERPAAGIADGSGGTGSAATTSGAGEVSASDPTAASLAESLAAAINGSVGSGSANSAPATPAASTTPTASSTPAASTTPAAATPAASMTPSTEAPATVPASSPATPDSSSATPNSSSAVPGYSTSSTAGGAAPGG